MAFQFESKDDTFWNDDDGNTSGKSFLDSYLNDKKQTNSPIFDSQTGQNTFFNAEKDSQSTPLMFNESTNQNESWINPNILGSEQAQLAMTRGQARELIDRFGNEALKRNITPEAFVQGITTFSDYANSPDRIRRDIRNTLATPGANTLLNNLDLLKSFTNNAIDASKNSIQRGGINPQTLDKYTGTGIGIIKQLQKDNLMRSNVTNAEIKEKVQKPFYGALMDWTKTNASNPAYQKIIFQTGFGKREAEDGRYGPNGLLFRLAGYRPEQFGVPVTAKGIRDDAIYRRQQAFENSPAGKAAAAKDAAEREAFRRQVQEIEAHLKSY